MTSVDRSKNCKYLTLFNSAQLTPLPPLAAPSTLFSYHPPLSFASPSSKGLIHLGPTPAPPDLKPDPSPIAGNHPHTSRTFNGTLAEVRLTYLVSTVTISGRSKEPNPTLPHTGAFYVFCFYFYRKLSVFRVRYLTRQDYKNTLFMVS